MIALVVLTWSAQYLPSQWSLFLALFAGLFIDSLTFRPLGETSVFFILAIGFLFLYQKKFETTHLLFGVVYTGIVTTLYLFLFGSTHLFFSLLMTLSLSCLLFGGSFFMRQANAKTVGNLV